MIESLSQIDWPALIRFSAPLIVIIATSAVILTHAALVDDEGSHLPAVVALAGLVISFILAWRIWPFAPQTPIATLVLDRTSQVGLMITIIAAIFAAMLSIPYLKMKNVRSADYFGLMLISTFGMGILISAANLVTILLGLEIMSLAAYALTGYLRTQEASIEGAIKYFLMGAFATAFFLMGVAFILGSTGTTDLALMSSRVGDIAAGDGRTFLYFGIAMVVTGFGFKVAAVPFHAWAPDAYDGAPTPVTSLMATGIKAAAFIAFIRIAASAGHAAGPLWHHLIWGISIITMVVGNLSAIRQDNLKRMLAYSSIAHAGYLLVVFPSLAADPAGAMRAVVLYLVAYVIMTAGAFAAIVAFGLGAGEPVDVNHLAGLAKKRPVLAASFALFLISLAGFPPTLGFFGKYYLFLTAVRNGEVSLVVAAVIMSVVSVYYYLRPVVVMYFREGKETEDNTAYQPPLSPMVVAVLAICAMIVIAFGIMPQDLVAFVQGSTINPLAGL